MISTAFAVIFALLAWTVWRDIKRGRTSRWSGMRIERGAMPLAFGLAMTGRLLATALFLWLALVPLLLPRTD